MKPRSECWAESGLGLIWGAAGVRECVSEVVQRNREVQQAEHGQYAGEE